MGEWDGLGPQASQYAGNPDGLGALMARLRRLERLVDRLTGANILGPAGVTAHKGGLTIASQLLVTGDTRIEGTLSLPAGVIDNDALASPVHPSKFQFAVGTFATPSGTWITPLSQALVVPEGFTKALVIAFGFVNLVNSLTNTTIFCGAQTVIASTGSPESREDDVGQYAWATMNPGMVQLVTGLSAGGSIPIQVRCYSSSALPGGTYTSASVVGAVLWFR